MSYRSFYNVAFYFVKILIEVDRDLGSRSIDHLTVARCARSTGIPRDCPEIPMDSISASIDCHRAGSQHFELRSAIHEHCPARDDLAGRFPLQD